ncbi:Heat shock protein GrpE [Moraxella catarrhalis]|nr:Heat shock protein GrpE [Moraxella catarrhalis]OAV18823.1 Heat shock protein GrpE [Moraxella catarrhalis]
MSLIELLLHDRTGRLESELAQIPCFVTLHDRTGRLEN